MGNLVRCPCNIGVSITSKMNIMSEWILSAQVRNIKAYVARRTRRPEGRIVLLFERFEYLHSLLYYRVGVVRRSHELRDCKLVVHV